MSLFILCNQDIDTSFFTLEMTWKGIRDSRIAQQIGVMVPETFEEIISGSTINTFIVKESFADFINACALSLLDKPDLLAKLKERTVVSTAAIRFYAEEMLPRVDSFSHEEAARVIERVRELQSAAVTFGTVVAFADVFGSVTERMNAILRLRSGVKYPLHVYSQVLGTPQEKSLTERAVEDICTSSASDFELSQKYFWLHQGYVGRGLTEKGVADVRTHTVSSSVHLPSRDEILSELVLTPEELHVFSAAQDVVIIKALRADSRQFLHVMLNRLLDRIAEKWNVFPDHLGTLSGIEIAAHLRAGTCPDADDLAKRFMHSVRIPENIESYALLVDADALAYTKTHLYRETIENRSDVKGQVANPGKATGKVRLVFGPQHNDKVCEGDILISTATSPQLLPAMKRAVAFVTDVGGITSHAAIVARELAKPCVVGTKHATEIFSDGDEVEVDAEQGIVRILRKA